MTRSLSTEEAARRLGCTSATVRRLIDQGVLTASRVERGTRFAWRVNEASVDEHLEAHGSYRSRDVRDVEARVAALEGALSEGAADGRGALLEAENTRLRDRVVDLEETLARTRAAAELIQQADAARSRTVELLSEAIGVNEQADRLRREAAAQMEEALANFTRSGPTVEL